MSPVTCSNCRISLGEDFAEGVERTPCPNCGSTIRAISIEPEPIHFELRGAGTAQLTVVTYPETLLRTAQRLFDEGQYSIAVVVAHMACEIATEHSMGEAFRARNLVDLEEAIEEPLNGYNLANERVRKLYVALTRDEIHTQPFWPTFRGSARRRNRIIHAGPIASKTEAEESLQATSALVAHLMRQGGPTMICAIYARKSTEPNGVSDE
jgi:hypothetical protein